jgi:teichuronic acid biosynthesis glycosyltransferase TuaH
MQNLVIIPYHDWRKISKEGARTRDAHFIESLREQKEVDKILIVNRPYTFLELLLKNKNFRVQGRVLLKDEENELIQLDHKTYIIDYRSKNILKHALLGRAWYAEVYQSKKVIEFTKKAMDLLKLEETNTAFLSQNILAASFCQNFSSYSIIFDAWDNFALMPGLAKIKTLLIKNYNIYKNIAPIWLTNSQQNINYYNKSYRPSQIKLLKNGVDFNRFNKKHDIPKELQNLPSPIIGFGGKITHLIDPDLFRAIIERNSDKSFVILGQILDRKVFNKIGSHKNLHYLGDKHYAQYPSYVTNFDIGIIPYKTGNNQHGGDSIKAYEYLAAGIKVVGTNDNGVEALGAHVYLARNTEEFHNAIQNTQNQRRPIDLNEHSWKSKALTLINEFNQL